jgi:hypothetical protein
MKVTRTYKVIVSYIRNGRLNLSATFDVDAETIEEAIYIAHCKWPTTSERRIQAELR